MLTRRVNIQKNKRFVVLHIISSAMLSIFAASGLLLGGIIADMFSYKAIYIVGLALVIISLITYKLDSQKDYKKRYEIAKQKN